MALATISIPSRALCRPMPLTLLLPDQGPPAGVLYLLHGFSDCHETFVHNSDLVRYCAGLPLVVAMPEAGCSFYADSAMGSYWQHITQEIPCWLSDTEYAYIRCTEYGEPQTLFTVSVSQRPGKLPTDGAGVYALKTGEQTVTCFDRFGDTLGTIQAPFVVGDIDTDIMFENGCIRLTYRGSGLDDPAQTALYLPTGEQVE